MPSLIPGKRTLEPGKPGNDPQHPHTQEEHEGTRDDRHHAFQCRGETEKRADSTDNAADHRIGDDPSRVVKQARNEASPARGRHALGKHDPAAHGDAVQGRQKTYYEEEPVAHGLVHRRQESESNDLPEHDEKGDDNRDQPENAVDRRGFC